VQIHSVVRARLEMPCRVSVNAFAVAWICEGVVTGRLTFELRGGMVIGGQPQSRCPLHCVETLQIMEVGPGHNEACGRNLNPHIITFSETF
jgi:hypothetical protein